MKIDLNYIDYLLSFEYLIAFKISILYPKGKPEYSVHEKEWIFNENSKAVDFDINKGEYKDPNIYNLISIRSTLRYNEYLNELFEQYKSEFHKSKSQSKDKSEFIQEINFILHKLNKSKSKSQEEKIFFSSEKSVDEYSQLLPWHKDVNIKYTNLEGRNHRDLTNLCFVNYVISQLVDTQLQIMDKTIDFLNDELKDLKTEQEKFALSISEENNNSMMANNEQEMEQISNKDQKKRKYYKIRFNDQINILGTLFYDLLEEQYITTTRANLKRFIVGSFLDVDGKALSESTIETLLKHGKEDKRAKNDTKIIVPERKTLS